MNVKLQETIKPNISNKTKNILGIDRGKPPNLRLTNCCNIPQ